MTRLEAAEQVCMEVLDFLKAFPGRNEECDIPPHRVTRIAKALLVWGVITGRFTKNEVQNALRKKFGI